MASLKCHPLPAEIWSQILSYLDIGSQNKVAQANTTMQGLIASLWRCKLARLSQGIHMVSSDHRLARQQLVVGALLEDLGPLSCVPVTSLYSLLATHQSLATPLGGCGKPSISPSPLLLSVQHQGVGEQARDQTQEYTFFHDYDKCHVKQLCLEQKWPRPGAKSLARFLSGNLDLVYLSVSDCRENIECVFQLTQHCLKLQALRLLATDPLLPYQQILNLKRLKYLELQFDSFYREHRDNLLFRLGDLPDLQVLKLHTAFGMTEEHVISILFTCTNLTHLKLPINSRINGWFLESVLRHLKNKNQNNNNKINNINNNRDEYDLSHLRSLEMTINTAYADLQTVIPQLHVFNLIKEANERGLCLKVDYCHKKLPSFNAKGFHS